MVATDGSLLKDWSMRAVLVAKDGSLLKDWSMRAVLVAKDGSLPALSVAVFG